VGVMDVDAIIVVVVELKRLPWFTRGTLCLLASRDLFDLHSLTGRPGPPVSIWATRAGGADTKRCARCLPDVAQAYKRGENSAGRSIFPTLHLLAPIHPILTASFLPPLAAMASNLPRSDSAHQLTLWC
jgi:hypothetical protein